MTDDKRPKFSILHPTIRLPDDWQTASFAWADNCDDPESVEYILTIDMRDWNARRPVHFPWFTTQGKRTFAPIVLIVNKGRPCYVDAQNTAAQSAVGDWLITTADDWFPCQSWDTMLTELVPDPLKIEAVVKVKANHHPALIIYPIMTRAYFERLGRGGCPNGELFYPEYLSMGSDDDLTEYATRDGVVIDAPHMIFEHRHHTLGLAAEDEAYKHVSAPETWEVKERVISRRRAENYSR